MQGSNCGLDCGDKKIEMTKKDWVTETIFAAVDDVNKMLSKEMRIEKSINAPLFGPSGRLDSLGLINMIVAIERRFEEECGVVLSLADESAMSKVNEVFETIGTLTDYVCRLLRENENSRT